MINLQYIFNLLQINHEIALFSHTIWLVIMLAPIQNQNYILFVCVRGAGLMIVN